MLQLENTHFTYLDNFKYLGVQVTDKFKNLFKYNCTPLLTQVQQDSERWSPAPLSQAGRINLVKVNILPKFFFLFQYVPVFISK